MDCDCGFIYEWNEILPLILTIYNKNSPITFQCSVPTAPLNVSTSLITNSSVVVTWHQPVRPNGNQEDSDVKWYWSDTNILMLKITKKNENWKVKIFWHFFAEKNENWNVNIFWHFFARHHRGLSTLLHARQLHRRQNGNFFFTRVQNDICPYICLITVWNDICPWTLYAHWCVICFLTCTLHIVKVKETQPKMEFQLTGLGESN